MGAPRSAAIDELLASEARLVVLLGCIKGIVFEFDRDARYVNAWTHDETLLARPPAELIGRTVNEVLGPAEGQRFTDAIRRVYDTGVPETLEYELVVQGGRRWFVADVIVSPDVAGRERTVVYLVREITAHRQLEEQLRKAQKMEAIGQLVGGVAHNFNNILTTIIGYSELLLDSLHALEGDAAGETQQRHAARIRNAAERASALTKQLLAYGGRRSLVPEVLDANAVISSMVHLLEPLLGERLDLRLELDPDLGPIRIDRSGLEQIIMNLALNARDAVPADGGVLTLRTHDVELGDREHDVAPGRFACIIASDNGHGIDPEIKSRIFEPFFTTKATGTGTGLGLSTVYGIVKQSGGRVDVDSAPGRGATFRVYLPIARS